MGKWTQEEDNLLIKLKTESPDAPWADIAKYFTDRSRSSIYCRWLKIDPSVNKGQWQLDEKVEIFEKVFGVVTQNLEVIEQSVQVKRNKMDIGKQIRQIQSIAAAGYLGPDYMENSEFVRRERKREYKSRAKDKKVKLDDTYDTINNLQKIKSRMKIGIVKEDRKDNGSGIKYQETDSENEGIGNERKNLINLRDLPPGISRDEFFQKINALSSNSKNACSIQEDQNLLQLYQTLGPNWHRISLLTDFKSEEKVKHRFCNLLQWASYNFHQKISTKNPLKSDTSTINTSVQLLLTELSELHPPKTPSHKIKFEPGLAISDSDTSCNSEFSY